MRLRLFLPCFFVLFLGTCVRAQQTDYFADKTFTRADTLRGSLRPERTSFDVTYYHLDIEVSPSERSLEGRVDMDYRVTSPTRRLQLDLFENMQIDSIQSAGRTLLYTRQGNAVFVDLPSVQPVNSLHRMSIWYGGQPVAAKTRRGTVVSSGN